MKINNAELMECAPKAKLINNMLKEPTLNSKNWEPWFFILLQIIFFFKFLFFFNTLCFTIKKGITMLAASGDDGTEVLQKFFSIFLWLIFLLIRQNVFF